MPYGNNSSGVFCSVKDCNHSNRQLYFWKKSECQEHLGLSKEVCPCLTPYGFHRFPKDPAARLQRISNINRKDYNPGKYASVCSTHFLEGLPTLDNPNPVLNLGYEPRKKVKPGRRVLIRDVSSKPPKRRKIAQDNCTAIPPTYEEVLTSGNTEHNVQQSLETLIEPMQQDDISQPSAVDPKQESGKSTQCLCEVGKRRPKMIDNSTQWDSNELFGDHTYCKRVEDDVHGTTKSKYQSCGTQVDMPSFPHKLTDNDYIFYTGLSQQTFLCLVTTLFSIVQSSFTKLEPKEQIFLVLCRLKLGLLFGDIARRFNISTSLASKIFNFWISVMAKELQMLVTWLPRDVIRSTMPECFKEHYPNTTCIIDCTEIIMERARSHWMRAVTYSQYKSRNTVKFLVAIAPNGFIMFVSDCFGGRTSDKFITEKSGFLDYLLPGDQVMADRGFTIDDILPPLVKLNVPPFTKGFTQLPEHEVTRARRIASVRVHVERVIARIKNFRFLKTCFPLSQSEKVDKIVLVCVALCNLQKSVIPQAIKVGE